MYFEDLLKMVFSVLNPVLLYNKSRTNGPIKAHLTIAQVMHRFNHNNEKQEALW